ncbi:type IV pilus modification protein PilV [Hydrogenophaga laconesensis]|uniref:Type IV pilus assembly protein PilV n=1 Tax=Hydrogenophaga laconesensis TaxID=1805971 RepID=A0ABU1V5L8_9BURK|nr:type IV pilus modification protein PilV [Hydrogenophaga laconesensis]MDR7092730.1 type IV pilus assembly protein PilV [Hydrogenophaga laconesensis]
MSPARHAEQGSMLLEALIAVLVLALGVLGLAATQTRTLVTARTTEFRNIAMRAVDDLQERMRANHHILLQPPAFNPYLTSWGEPPQASTNCDASPCEGFTMAAHDIAEWKTMLARSLPDGDAWVFPSTQDPTQFGVLVAWTDPRLRNDSHASEADIALFAQAVSVRDAQGQAGTGVAGLECLARHTCHLVYFRP